MREFIQAVTILLCLLTQSVSSYANKGDKKINHILIVNTYSDANPWSNSLILPIVNLASRHGDMGAYTAHLKMLTLQDTKDFKSYKKKIRKELSNQSPSLIVFIGCASFILCDELNKQWPDIPMLLCGERDYTGPEDCVADGHALSPEMRIPLKSMQGRMNLTLMHASNHIEENIRLMEHMIPKMNKLMYIGDETYICQQNNYDISEVIRNKHPELSYDFISAKDVTTDSLFTILNKVNTQTTGILYTSWFRKQDYKDNTIMVNNSHRIIATSSIPLFSSRTVGIKDATGFVGGYFYDEKAFIKQMLSTIQEILNGKAARNFPFYYATDGVPTFNYNSLKQLNLDPKRCPKNTVFYNMPPTFWEQYEYIIIICICVIIILMLAFQHHRLLVLKKMKKLQQNELDTATKYYTLINNMPIIYQLEELIKDENGQIVETRFIDVNRLFEEKILRRDKVIGKLGSEIFPQSMTHFLYFMNIALKEKRSVTFSYYSKEDNAFYDIVINAYSDERHMDIFCLDSTELHRAQMQLSSINHKLSMALDIANIVPWKWNLQTHTILCDVNKPIELNHENIGSNEEQLSVPDHMYFAKIHKEDLPKVKKAYADLIAKRTTKVKEEYRVINRINGCKQIDWVEAQAAIESYDEKGEPLTLIGSSLIITERKRMETDLISAKNRAEESNRLKSAFLANMSHEIRTPLNAIVGFSGILASTEEEKEKQEYVSIIENNNALLLQLISDILDLSKIEAGTMEFVNTDFDLNRVMTELESALRLKLSPEKNVELIFESRLPDCHIYAERNRISQIIINLVTNAIKFTDTGSIRFGYEKRGKTLYFYVTDTGCGIPDDKQKDVFGRFVKLNNFAQGTGLGLSICQTLVQHMGGNIGLQSKSGEGSTFWFTLPYTPSTHIRQQEVKTEPIKMKQQKITILIAEDHDSNYRLIESILKKDYNLIHAWNGEEAVAMFKTYAPQLILMDINMPVMNGYEATREIRKLSTQVPIIAVTAFAYASDEQKVMENGFDAYMAKPINANQLKGQITSILKQHIIFM